MHRVRRGGCSARFTAGLARAAAATEPTLSVGPRRCVITEIPSHAVNPRLHGTVDFSNLRAGFVRHGDFDRVVAFQFGLQEVIHNHAVGRIGRQEIARADVSFIVRQVPGDTGPHIEQMQIGGQHVVGHFFERGDVVHDPQRAAVRGENQIVIAGMDLEIVHRHCRQSIFHAFPVSTAIK